MERSVPNVSLPDAMLDYAERQVEAGVYANLSEVVRAGLRKLMEEDGATAFYLLRRDLGAAITEPTEEADLRALLLDEPSQP
jgi:antitoxin ParD1/3/4